MDWVLTLLEGIIQELMTLVLGSIQAEKDRRRRTVPNPSHEHKRGKTAMKKARKGALSKSIGYLLSLWKVPSAEVMKNNEMCRV